MRAVGRMSYSWYLWHWPVLLLAPLLGHPLGLAGRLATVLISGGLAVLTLRLVENPLRFAAPLRRSPLASLALGAAATVVAVCVGVALLTRCLTRSGAAAPAAALTITVSPPPPGSQHRRVRRGGAEGVRPSAGRGRGVRGPESRTVEPRSAALQRRCRIRAMFLSGCMRNVGKVGQPECATGDTASTTTVALVGDFHATMWTPAFQQVAEQRHWRLETLTKGACPPMSTPITNFLGHLLERFQRLRGSGAVRSSTGYAPSTRGSSC